MSEKPLSFRIIALAPNKWDYVWMNRQQLLSRLGKRHEVLYTNGPLFFYNRRQPAFQDAPLIGRTNVMDNVRVDVPGKLSARWPRFPVWDHIALRANTRRWRNALNADTQSPLVSYIFHPQFQIHTKFLPSQMLIYHAYDLFSLTPNWSDQDEESETELLAKADLIVASSEPIANALSKRCNRTVYCIPNGVDDRLYANKAVEPADLEQIPRPRLGYVGRITDKLDYSLLLNVFSTKPAWQLILVGPVEYMSPEYQESFANLRALENVHVLGPRDKTDVPNYLRFFDVGLMPYRKNGIWTSVGYPLKLHEYLLANLPIVSTNIETMLEFSNVALLASKANEWSTGIQRCLDGRAPGNFELRHSIAKKHTWDALTDELERLLLERFGELTV